MPKLKTHKGIKKRVRLTANGKITRSKAGRRHILSKKKGKRLRQMRRKLSISEQELKRIKTLLVER